MMHSGNLDQRMTETDTETERKEIKTEGKGGGLRDAARIIPFDSGRQPVIPFSKRNSF